MSRLKAPHRNVFDSLCLASHLECEPPCGPAPNLCKPEPNLLVVGACPGLAGWTIRFKTRPGLPTVRGTSSLGMRVLAVPFAFA